MIYTVLSVLYLAALAGIALYYVTALLRRSRAEKIRFLQNFKKGNFVVVYLLALPVYTTGLIYAGERLLPAVLAAFKQAVALITLECEVEPISPLMQDVALFRYAVYLCFGVVVLNAALLAISLLFQHACAVWNKLRFALARGDKLVLIGNTAQNKQIYTSERRRMKAVVDRISDQEGVELYKSETRYVRAQSTEKFVKGLVDRCFKHPRASYLAVLNTGDDAKNLSLCHALAAAYRDARVAHPAVKPEQVLGRLRVYVYGNPAHEAIYTSLSDASEGCIRYINKYRQIATDFIDRYPLTRFMTKAQIDYDTALIKEDVALNVALIGFGGTNQQIFLSSVAGNQFLTRDGEGVTLKQVNYLIFDKKDAEKNKNLNHSYYRFKNEFEKEIAAQASAKEGEPQPYLPFPTLPAHEDYHHLDVNDPQFYRDLRALIDRKPEDLSYVVIAFGKDLENVDMAQKLLDKKAEWGVENLFVFVKVRSGNDCFPIFARKDCFLIADENRAAYHIDKIDDEEIVKMAKMRHQLYEMETHARKSNYRCITSEEMEKIRRSADYNWHASLGQFERDSNLYACLGLRTKLHLLGLDYQKDDGKGLSKEEYLDVYAAGDLPRPSGLTLRYEVQDAVSGAPVQRQKEIFSYGLDFRASKRGHLAIQEHYRWNSYIISKGFVPASKKEILTLPKNGKDYVLRRHGNLTTFEGLVEFRKMLATGGRTEEDTDVIRYDYQLLDDAYWLLTENGYCIVKK
ncbi:MAG: hypothetical protein J6U87_02985 [Clostridia bacterium]|nr:hypothetical protein [Clostridia bacterium]